MLVRIFDFFKELIGSILTFLKILLKSKFFLPFPKTSSESIYILGNGPSLRVQMNEVINNRAKSSVMCVNGFPLTPEFEVIKPNYFVICSPGFYNSDAVDYNVDLRKQIIDSLVSKCTWDLIFFLPIGAKKSKAFIQNISSNYHIKIQYYNTTPVEGLRLFNELFFNLGLGSPRPHNVLIPSILNAIRLEYQKIYLLGADHSWLPLISVNEENEVLINQKHFYDENSSTPRQMHKNEGKDNRKLHEVLDKFLISFRSYHELNSYAKSKSVRVINLTNGSFIDAFPKETRKAL